MSKLMEFLIRGGVKADARNVFGVLVEFETTDQLMVAARRVRERGYTRWDAHTPFPVHGLDQAMGIRATILPMAVFCFGLLGVLTAFLLQWWTNGHDYQLLISNKPNESPWRMLPAMVPVMFELMVLFSAFGGAATLFVFCGLPAFYHPLFNSARFARATNDRFFICMEADDPAFRLEETEAFADSLGGIAVELVPRHPVATAASVATTATASGGHR